MSNRRYDTIICSGEEIKMFMHTCHQITLESFFHLHIHLVELWSYSFTYSRQMDRVDVRISPLSWQYNQEWREFEPRILPPVYPVPHLLFIPDHSRLYQSFKKQLLD